LPRLYALYVADNQLTALPDALGLCPYLHTLDVRNNQLTTVPKAARHLKNLERLDLRGNPIPDAEIAALRKARPKLRVIWEATDEEEEDGEASPGNSDSPDGR
jgi:aminoglycoside phosphotransferase